MKLYISDSERMKAKDPIKSLSFDDEEKKVPVVPENGGENLYKKRTIQEAGIASETAKSNTTMNV